MDLNEIKVFIEVVRKGSFSQAAKKLRMPNSTVSSKISSLELRLGTTLIQRTTRKLNVTLAGEAYFKRCVQGLEEIIAAENEVASTQAEPSGVLRLTAPVDLGSKLLPGIVSRYLAKYRNARVELIFADRNVDLIGEGIDLAIRTGNLNDSSLIARKIGITHYALFASPKYLKVKGALVHPRELNRHICLTFSPTGMDEWSLVNSKSSIRVPIVGRVIASNFTVLKNLALMGDGIVYLPSFLLQEELAAGKLVQILPEWSSDQNPVQFVYPNHRFVTPKVNAFISIAMVELKKAFDRSQ